MKNISFILYACTLSALAMPHEKSSSSPSANMKELGYADQKLFGIEQSRASMLFLKNLGLATDAVPNKKHSQKVLSSAEDHAIGAINNVLNEHHGKKDAQFTLYKHFWSRLDQSMLPRLVEQWPDLENARIEEENRKATQLEPISFAATYLKNIDKAQAEDIDQQLQVAVKETLSNLSQGGNDKAAIKNIYDALNRRICAEFENNLADYRSEIEDSIKKALIELGNQLDEAEQYYRSFEQTVSGLYRNYLAMFKAKAVEDVSASMRNEHSLNAKIASLNLEKKKADKLEAYLKDIQEVCLVDISFEADKKRPLTEENKSLIKGLVNNTVLAMLSNTTGYEQTAQASFKHHVAALEAVSKSAILSDEAIAEVFMVRMSQAWQAISSALVKAKAPVVSVAKSDASIIAELQKDDLGLLSRLGSVFRKSETSEEKGVKAIFAQAEKAYGATAVNEHEARIFPDYAITAEQRALIDAQTHKVYEAVRAVAAEARGKGQASVDNLKEYNAISDVMKIFNAPSSLAEQVRELKAHSFWNVLMSQLPEDAAVEYIVLLSKAATDVNAHFVRARDIGEYNKKIEALVVAVSPKVEAPLAAEGVDAAAVAAASAKQAKEIRAMVMKSLQVFINDAKTEIKKQVSFSDEQSFEVFGAIYDLLTKDLNNARAKQPSTFAEDLTQLLFGKGIFIDNLGKEIFINNPEIAAKVFEQIEEYKKGMFEFAGVEAHVGHVQSDDVVARLIWPNVGDISSVDRSALIKHFAMEIYKEDNPDIKKQLLDEYQAKVAALDGQLKQYAKVKQLIARINSVYPNSRLDEFLVFNRLSSPEVLKDKEQFKKVLRSTEAFLSEMEDPELLSDSNIYDVVNEAVKALGLEEHAVMFVADHVKQHLSQILSPAHAHPHGEGAARSDNDQEEDHSA